MPCDSVSVRISVVVKQCMLICRYQIWNHKEFSAADICVSHRLYSRLRSWSACPWRPRCLVAPVIGGLWQLIR